MCLYGACSRKQPGSGHCIALQPGSSGLGLTAASRAAVTVVAGLQTTDGIRSSAAPRTAIGKPGCGVCSAAARHYLD